MPTAIRVIDRIEEINSSFTNGQVPQWNSSLHKFEGVSGGYDRFVEVHTMTSGELLAGSFLLAHTPTDALDTQISVVGGPAQAYAVDFTVSVNTVTLLGDLLSTLQAGDKLEVAYPI